MSAAVQQMFDRIAPTYDTVNRTLSAGIDQRWRRLAIASLRLTSGAERHGGLDPVGPVCIDLCAGTLDLTRMLVAAGARVQAVDFSCEMLQKGRLKLLPGTEDRVSILAADATALPLQGGLADGLVCGFGIRNVDRDRLGLALSEARRVLRPGGRLAVLEFFRPQRRLTRAAHWLYNRHVLPTVGGLISGDRDAYTYLVRSIEGFLSVEEFSARLSEAGFVGIEHRDLTLGIASLVTAQAPGGGT